MYYSPIRVNGGFLNYKDIKVETKALTFFQLGRASAVKICKHTCTPSLRNFMELCNVNINYVSSAIGIYI